MYNLCLQPNTGNEDKLIQFAMFGYIIGCFILRYLEKENKGRRETPVMVLFQKLQIFQLNITKVSFLFSHFLFLCIKSLRCYNGYYGPLFSEVTIQIYGTKSIDYQWARSATLRKRLFIHLHYCFGREAMTILWNLFKVFIEFINPKVILFLWSVKPGSTLLHLFTKPLSETLIVSYLQSSCFKQML